MSRSATVINHLIEEDPSTAVERALSRLQPPTTSVRCCRPNCGKEFIWNGQGRTPRFCSPGCRIRFPKEKARLQADLESYEALRDCPSTWARQVEIDSRIAILKMHLVRYRPF